MPTIDLSQYHPHLVPQYTNQANFDVKSATEENRRVKFVGWIRDTLMSNNSILPLIFLTK